MISIFPPGDTLENKVQQQLTAYEVVIEGRKTDVNQLLDQVYQDILDENKQRIFRDWRKEFMEALETPRNPGSYWFVNRNVSRIIATINNLWKENNSRLVSYKDFAPFFCL